MQHERRSSCLAAALAATFAHAVAAAPAFPTIESGDEGPVRTLARIELSDGRLIQFLVASRSGEIFVGETVEAGQESRLPERWPPTPLQYFLQLTPRDVPVPEALLGYDDWATPPASSPDDRVQRSESGQDERPSPDSADTRKAGAIADEVADRGIVETLASIVFVDVAPDDSGTSASGGSCGAQGQAEFEQGHCDTLGPYGYGIGEGDCDSGLSSSIQRSSARRMRHTYTRIAACGVSGKVVHRYSTNGGWVTQFSAVGAPDTVTSWYSYKTGVARHRRANFERLGNSGGVRGWTHFFQQVTD